MCCDEFSTCKGVFVNIHGFQELVLPGGIYAACVARTRGPLGLQTRPARFRVICSQ